MVCPSNRLSRDVVTILVSVLLSAIYFSTFGTGPVGLGRFGSANSNQTSGSSAPLPSMEQFLATFKARDPKYQQQCVDIMSKQENGFSQHEQDIFLFHNVFKPMALQGKKGFYLDLGSNDAIEISNTVFFDKCLGWSGFCVEPQKAYHGKYSVERTCELIPNCVADKEMTTRIDQGATAHIGQDSGEEVKCLTLATLMQRVPNGTCVDLISLDVEGHEIPALATIQPEHCVRHVILEDFWLPRFKLDWTMSHHGFSKTFQMHGDALYSRRDGSPYVYPPQWQHNYQRHVDFARREDTRERLTKLSPELCEVCVAKKITT